VHVLLLLALAADGWEEVDRADGIVIEARERSGSRYHELRATTQIRLKVDALCQAAFGPDTFDAQEPSLKSRKLISASEGEHVHYDQMATPIVKDRDLVVRDRMQRDADGSCHVQVDAIAHPDVPVREDHVRIEGLHASWSFQPLPNGETSVTHVTWTDPKVSLPLAMVEAGRRRNLVEWVKLILQRAGEAQTGVKTRH
jgi:hypothetical protein